MGQESASHVRNARKFLKRFLVHDYVLYVDVNTWVLKHFRFFDVQSSFSDLKLTMFLAWVVHTASIILSFVFDVFETLLQ